MLEVRGINIAYGALEVLHRVDIKVNERRIVGLFVPHRFRLLSVFGLALVAAGISLLPPLAIKRLIDVALPAHDSRLLLGMVGVLAVAPFVAGLVGVAFERIFCSPRLSARPRRRGDGMSSCS